MNYLLIGLLLLTMLGLVFQSSIGNKNLAMDEGATLGERPDRNLLVSSLDNEQEIRSTDSTEQDTSTIYKWNEEVFDWVEIGELERLNHPPDEEIADIDPNITPKLKWETLMDIRYQLKYYPELDFSVFAPIFGPKLENLDGQKVVIEGFIIPVDEEEGIWALSAFPVASCFFCGQASPASVLSVYFSEGNKRKRYETGDKLSLTGSLDLNHDDPVELYYIIREAEGRSIQ